MWFDFTFINGNANVYVKFNKHVVSKSDSSMEKKIVLLMKACRTNTLFDQNRLSGGDIETFSIFTVYYETSHQCVFDPTCTFDLLALGLSSTWSPI